ncbi:sensor histidine kinase [Paenibacillus sp. DCT19]|uniref:sensor histidine kinase n=1 Tax=Paenibacillus sp. DCT19 TaxID=2211212 RepID=UPI000FE1B0A1|nr:hypothetical protein [Paenibacillus sp. DCT19]
MLRIRVHIHEDIREEGSRVSSGIVIRILDNGQGLPEGWRMEDTSGIGVQNVHQRIQLYCGTHYGVRIGASELGGVEVIIRLPRIETEEQLNQWLGGENK